MRVERAPAQPCPARLQGQVEFLPAQAAACVSKSKSSAERHSSITAPSTHYFFGPRWAKFRTRVAASA
eukprot:COSAG06_NODE_64_length_26790_cov_7.462291_3_plen_68_part_00